MRKTIPTFNVYLANGKRKHGLVRCFLDRMCINSGETTLVLPDSSEWTLYLESSVADALKRLPSVYCIVSFQVYNTGEAIAVARLYRSNNHE